MSDTFITVIAILLAVVLLVVVPLQVTSQRVDTMSKLDVDTLTSDFVEQIRTTGSLTKDDYYNFKQKLTSTGNTYDVNMEFKILDENPGKKTTQVTRDKIGENVYYSVYTAQVEKTLEDEKNDGKYSLKEGDLVSVTVRNTNLTIGQQMKNFVYKVVGNDTYTIAASKSGLVTASGATSTILSNSVDKPEITAIFKENDAKGNVITKNNTNSSELTNKWTNQNVYVELSSKDNYAVELLFYRRNYKNSTDYNGYDQISNNFTLTDQGVHEYQVFWKSSLLVSQSQYSEIKKLTVRIDKTKPTLNISTTEAVSNSKNINVSASDTGGSGIAGYCHKWSEPNQTPSLNGGEEWSGNNFITANPENNDKKCTVWVKDNAGNISDAKSIIVHNIVKPVTKVSLNGAIIKQGETATLKAILEGGNDFKNIKFESSNNSIATVSSNGKEVNVRVTGKSAGKATIKCTVTNHDNTTQTVEATVTVTSIAFNPNSGTYKISYTDKSDRVTLRSRVNVYGEPSKTEYAWSNSNNQVPNNWQQFTTGNEVTNIVSNPGNYYLWIRATDQYNNSVTYVSNNFYVKYKVPDASQIKVNYSAKYWTNQDVIVRVESNIADFGIQISTDVKNWYSNTTYVFTTNGTIYARFYDKTTQEIGNIMAINVNNIDKTPIKITNQITCTGNSSDSISVRLTSVDNESGFCKVVWHYTVISTGEHYTTEDVECNMNGYETGNRENVIKEKTLTNLRQGNLYEIYAEIYDVAGNMVRTNAIEQLAGKRYGNIKVTENNPTTCIGKNLTFSVTSNKSGGKLSVSSDNTSIADASISGNKITVQPKGVGKANIVVTSAETQNYYMTNTSISVEFFNHIPTEGGNKKSDATCTSPAVYYKKCSECGKQLTSTYTSGNALGHDYKTEKIIGDWKFTENKGSGGTGKIAAVFNRAGQYARFTYSSSNPHTMKVLYCTSDTSSSIDLCLGTTTSATSATIAFRAWGSGYKILYNNGKQVNDSSDTPGVGANGMYNSYIDWGHNSKGTWTFTIFSNSDNTAAHPTTCVRKYCSRCSHSEDYYREY
ncbi:putative uncharacterized protein [Clostridium sp. CAG:470]|jgi:conserved hypothetical protein|nr:MAG: hypothetical protein BHW03_01655 [Clostridium sp. 28_17]CDE14343.1 putative uncharacterized protein [Clostridium sp. CAG:470]